MPRLPAVEAEDDPLARDADRHQIVRNPVLCPVALDPDQPILDGDMHQAAMNTSWPLPTAREQHELIAGAVNDQLVLDIAIRIV